MAARHRARKLAATQEDHSRDRELELFREAKERGTQTGIPYSVDHVFPLAKGGPHHHDNLQVIPAALNQSKKDSLTWRHPEFLHWTELPQHVLDRIAPETLAAARAELAALN